MDASFIYMPLEDLQALKIQCQGCLTDNFKAHQSYTIAGRTITRANIASVAKMLSEISYAIAYQTGQISRYSVADMSHSG